MGLIQLRPQEAVLFPTPYVEDEPAELVVTSQRILQLGPRGRQEIEAAQIGFVGRHSVRPFIFLGLFLLVMGLAVGGFGAYRWYSVQGMPTFDERPPDEDAPTFADPATVRLQGMIIGGVGAGLGLIGLWLCKRRRHFVICRGDKWALKLPVADDRAQMQVMMTVQSLLTSARMAPAPPRT